MPLLGIPKKRLFVLAGVTDCEMILTPICKTQPEAVLLSFLDLRNNKHWPQLRDALDAWPHYRYLDSGVFTFITRFMTKGIPMTREQIRPVFEDYCEFLKANHQHFSWVIDFDVDSVEVDGSPPPGLGVEITREHRRELRKIVGDKLLPVWHIAAGYAAWKELIADYRYVAIGPDRNRRDLPEFQALVQLAHAADVKVHGLMVGTFNTMARVPYDTADSANWLYAVKVGHYAGSVKYTDRRPPTTGSELVKACQLEEDVRALGYDPSLLIEGTNEEKLEISIRLIQQEQEGIQWRENPKVRTTSLKG